jgi:hypothetical protein
MSERAEALTKLGLREVEVSIILTIPVTAPAQVDDRLIGALSAYAADLMWVREAGFRKMHVPTDDLLFLHNEVRIAGSLFRGIDPGEVFGVMTCTEAEALAGIFTAAGDQDTAVHIINSHGLRDQDPEDQHHTIYEEAQHDDED